MTTFPLTPYEIIDAALTVVLIYIMWKTSRNTKK